MTCRPRLTNGGIGLASAGHLPAGCPWLHFAPFFSCQALPQRGHIRALSTESQAALSYLLSHYRPSRIHLHRILLKDSLTDSLVIDSQEPEQDDGIRSLVIRRRLARTGARFVLHDRRRTHKPMKRWLSKPWLSSFAFLVQETKL